MTNLRTRVQVSIDVERWAVGAPSTFVAETALPMRIERSADTDGDPVPYAPATSLAGSLRRHLAMVLDPPTAEEWLGEPVGASEVPGSDDHPKPGRLWLLRSTVTGSQLEARRRTAVNPRSGAAARNGLWLEQYATPGTVVLIVQHDGGPDEALLRAFASWQPYLGRGRSGGLGAGRVTLVRRVTIDLDEPHHLTWWLSRRHQWPRLAGPPGSDHTETVTASSVSLALPEIQWRLTEPLHVGNDEPLDQVTPALKSGGRPLVPGESLKGVFRSRCQVILRACGLDAITTESWLGRIFGSASTGRGLLRFEDLTVEDGAATIQRTHNAIDRFSGGVADGALFTLEAIASGVTATQRIVAIRDVPEPVKNLLLHVLRDLHDGLIGVGGHVTRGYGSLALVEPDNFSPTPVVLDDLRRELEGAS